MKLGTGAISIHQDYDERFYADNNPYLCVRSHPDIRIEAEFYIQPFFSKLLNTEVTHIVIDPEKADPRTVKEILKDL